MKPRFLLPIFALLIAALACSFSFSTANIDNARLARDADGNDTSAQFNADETVFVVFDLKNAPEDTEILAVWYYTTVDTDGVETHTELDRSETINTSSAEIWFSFLPQNGWQAGTHRVDLVLNTVVEQTLTFEILDQVSSSDTTE